MPSIRAGASRKIDAYIRKAEPFARPILKRLRTIIMKAHPEIVEDWKWGPNFNKDGMVCGIWGFQRHVTLTFFRGSLLKDPKKILIYGTANASNRAVKFTSTSEVHERTLTAYIREAIRLNERGPWVRSSPTVLKVPVDLRNALKAKPKARDFFDTLTHTHRKEYILWITSAKKPETRARRIATAVAMLLAKKRSR